MTKCAFCGKKIQELPYYCRRCNKHFCSEHRLPEGHQCERVYHRIKRNSSAQKLSSAPPQPNSLIQKISSGIISSSQPNSGHSNSQENNVIVDTTRATLCNILEKYGTDILENPNRLKAFLKDFCKGQNSHEINAIICTAEERIPQEILKTMEIKPLPLLKDQLKKKILKNTYLSEQLVDWVIISWFDALGVSNKRS